LDVGIKACSHIVYTKIIGSYLQLLCMKKDALLGFDLLIHTLFWHKTTGPEQGAEQGILREKKSRKKGVSCFVYTL
jgi:hypothetical protein